MLKKLLKYDLRAVFKLWWIAAAVTVVMAVLGGFAGLIQTYSDRLPEVITVITGFVRFFAYFCIAALFVLTQVLLFVRYYKNFFTDEGYLTFTLPANREALLNSKVITGILAMLATSGIGLLNFGLMNYISGNWDIIFDDWSSFREFCASITEETGIYLLIYSGEVLMIAAITLLLSVLFLFCCITFGSMIVKRGKLLASIGIYYGATSIFVTTAQLLLIFGIGSIGVWFSRFPEEARYPMLTLVLLIILLFLAALCALIYAFTYWMLDRKLNLS